jgi:hypothetical protein
MFIMVKVHSKCIMTTIGIIHFSLKLVFPSAEYYISQFIDMIMVAIGHIYPNQILIKSVMDVAKATMSIFLSMM